MLAFITHIFPTHSLGRRLGKEPILRVAQFAAIIRRDNIVEGSRYVWFGILLSDGRVL